MAGLSRNVGGGGKVVTFEEETIGRRHRNGSLSTYLDIGSRDVSAAGRPLQPPHGAPSRRRTYADGELDVFAAERYFKGGVEDGDRHRRKEDGVVVPPAPLLETAERPRVAVTKPVGTRTSAASVSSATSANSRTMLLRSGGHRSRRGHRDDNRCCGVHFGALLTRTCSGKRSVRVDSGGVVATKEISSTGGPTTTQSNKVDWYRELRMQKAALGVGDVSNSLGVVAVAAGHLPPNLNLGTAKVAAIGREDKPAEFTFSSSSTRRFTLVAPVRDSVPANGLVGDAGNGGGDGNDDDDDGSESSSDLFEIKSLMIDDSPYEPSEASIQWSVATASAMDGPERCGRVSSARWITDGSHSGRGRGRGPPAGLLSGCVSHRAVEVSAAANAPRRRFEKARNGGA